MNSGLIVLLLLALLILGAYLVWAVLMRPRLTRFLQKLRASAPPDRISLSPVQRPDWREARQIEKMAGQFDALGFARGQAYTVAEMPVTLWSLFREDGRACAVIYEHTHGGLFVDLTAFLANDRVLTITNNSAAQQLDSRPGVEKIYVPDADPAELWAEMQARIGSETVRAIDDSTFPAAFERSYQEDMAWRNRRGGVTADEFDRVAAGQGMGLSEEERQQGLQQVKVGELVEWERACLEQFNTVTPAPDTNRYYRVFIFHPSFHAGAYRHYLTTTLDFREAVPVDEAEGSLALGQGFHRFLSERDWIAERLGSVTEPIAAEIYGVRART